MSAISTNGIRVFTDAVKHFFAQMTQDQVVIDTAFLATDGKPQCYDYTGLVAVAGEFRGCVYFSAPRVMLRHLLMSMGEMDHRDENLLDLVGEVANTFSGNAREQFGPAFAISVPVAVKGEPEHIKPGSAHTPPHAPFVISVRWKSYSAAVVVCIDGERRAHLYPSPEVRQ